MQNVRTTSGNLYEQFVKWIYKRVVYQQFAKCAGKLDRFAFVYRGHHLLPISDNMRCIANQTSTVLDAHLYQFQKAATKTRTYEVCKEDSAN